VSAQAQLSLLDLLSHMSPARARRTDCDSSHVAADKAERDGTIGRQAAAALALVRRYPGRTSKELARLGSLDRYQLARRLPELRTAGVVERTDEESECRWWPK